MKWTKTDIKRMQGAISSFWVCNRPLDWRDVEAFGERFRAVLAEKRQEIVIAEIDALRSMAVHYAEQNASTAKHYRDHFKDEETFARFDGYAADERKTATKAEVLIARIRKYGLPAEVIAFDPSAPLGGHR